MTVIHTRGFYNGPTHTGFMEVELCTIKAAKIIDYTYHEFQGVMRFEIKTLVAFNSVTSGMPFGERVSGKAFYLEPNALAYFFWISFFPAVLEKLVFNSFEFSSERNFPDMPLRRISASASDNPAK